MNKKQLNFLEGVARKVWKQLHYEEVVEASLKERKILLLFEDADSTLSSEEVAEVEAQSDDALSELQKAIQTASDIFGSESNTVSYLKSLGDEVPDEKIDTSEDADPRGTAEVVAKKAGSAAQIQKVIDSINSAIKTFGSELSKIPVDSMQTEIQKLPDETKIDTETGTILGKDLKTTWQSLPLIDISDIAEALTADPSLGIDWTKMPAIDNLITGAESAFKLEEPAGFLGKIMSFLGFGGFDKKQFAEDMVRVSFEKVLQKYEDIPAPEPSETSAVTQTVTDLEGEITSPAAPTPPGTPPATGDTETEEDLGAQADAEAEEDSVGDSYKITPDDIRNIKAAMETAKGKKKSQSKALGSYLNQALDQDIFEESFSYDFSRYDIEELEYYKLMRMAGISED